MTKVLRVVTRMAHRTLYEQNKLHYCYLINKFTLCTYKLYRLLVTYQLTIIVKKTLTNNI